MLSGVTVDSDIVGSVVICGTEPLVGSTMQKGRASESDKSDSRTQRGIARQSHRESLSLIESRASQREKERSPVLDPGHLINVVSCVLACFFTAALLAKIVCAREL